MFGRTKPAPAPAHTGPAISLDKVQAAAPGLVSLAKTAAISLDKQGLTGHRAAVYLVIDRSYSMAGYYRDGSVQRLAEQVLGLSVNLDDDGTVPLVFFDTRPYPIVDVDLRSYHGVVARQHQLHGGEPTMGGTQYTAAMRAVIEHHQCSGATDPAFVIFQTDGMPQDAEATKKLLADASRLPIMWSFCGFGTSPVRFLQQLDHLRGRVIDNASYHHAGANPVGVPDSELYDQLLREFPAWLTAARARGITQ